MKKILLLVFFVSAFALLAGTVYGEETGSTDGSTPDDGSVPSSEGTVSSDPENLPSELQELQPAVMDDPEVMKTVAGLASDPNVQALAYDPEVVKAVKSLDFKTLMAKQKIADAVDHPKSESDDQKEQ
ncbi:MAG: hypothetical protein V1673_00290 [Candidatus Omnitrophota bacterium]